MCPRTLVGFDYDGTLARITRHPAQAQMLDETRELLDAVAQRFPTVIVTGRKRSDALGLLRGVRALEVIGSHGTETGEGVSSDFRPAVADWRMALHERIGALPGVVIEDKEHSLSVHYRSSRTRRKTEAAIRAAAQSLPGVRLVGGKCVLNIVAENAPDKGAALLSACRRAGCERALFTGDDITDEDVFALLGREPILGIRVGRHGHSRAAFYVRHRREVDALLRQILGQPRG
jgi:trehalose 6-phosphate phosphatase